MGDGTPLMGEGDTPVSASEVGGHCVAVAAEVWIRQDQTRKIVDWLRGGPPHDHDYFDREYADMIERKFGAA